jgi:hypothetical protein
MCQPRYFFTSHLPLDSHGSLACQVVRLPVLQQREIVGREDNVTTAIRLLAETNRSKRPQKIAQGLLSEGRESLPAAEGVCWQIVGSDRDVAATCVMRKLCENNRIQKDAALLSGVKSSHPGLRQ